MKKLLIILVFVVVISLVSCGGQGSEPTRKLEMGPVVRIGPDVTRFVDDDAGVVCWIYNGYQSNSISCLPIGDTNVAYSNE